jgi:hypothetical protein
MLAVESGLIRVGRILIIFAVLVVLCRGQLVGIRGYSELIRDYLLSVRSMLVGIGRLLVGSQAPPLGRSACVPAGSWGAGVTVDHARSPSVAA